MANDLVAGPWPLNGCGGGSGFGEGGGFVQLDVPSGNQFNEPRFGGSDHDNEMIVWDSTVPAPDGVGAEFGDVGWVLESAARRAGGAHDDEIARRLWVEGQPVDQGQPILVWRVRPSATG